LPARGEFVIRDAYVMSFDPALGDLPAWDWALVQTQADGEIGRGRVQGTRVEPGEAGLKIALLHS
jgi:hypothetical protein